MPNMRKAEAFHPGEFLRDELEAREWTQTEFAEIIGRPIRLVNEIIKGRRAVTPETAKELGAALGTSAEFWMNLEIAYQLWKAAPVSPNIERQAKIRTQYPVREMIKRRWIHPSEDVHILENRIVNFFELSSLDETPALAYAAKRSNEHGELSPIQLAWIYRVKHIAKSIAVTKYSPDKLSETVIKLQSLRSSVDNLKYIPSLLKESGVRFIIVEHIPSSKIDGVCLWIDDSPVIGLSLRFDRIDNFWFVLRHEIEHILQGHGKSAPIVDIDLLQSVSSGTEKVTPEEEVANIASADFCVPQQKFEHFIAEVAPYVSRKKVLEFASSLEIHPGLVVGQIQRRLNRYDLFRKMLVPVRKTITAEAVTDGYGYFFSS